MEKLAIDERVCQKLNSPLEICDPSGRTIGYFVPVCEPSDSRYQEVNAQFDQRRIEQARRQEGGNTTAQILERLRSSAP